MNKSIRILLIVFVALIALYFLFFRSKERVNTDKIDAKLFVADSSKIDKIEIVKTSETIMLEKVNGQWMVTKPVNYAADTNAIGPMLKDLKNFILESVASENPAKFNTFLDSVNNPQITAYQDGKLLGTFILGKMQGYGNSFLKKTDENRILLASGITAANFTKPLKDYRKKVILSLNTLSINKVDFKSTDSNQVNFSVVKDSVNKWSVQGGDTISYATMDSFLNTFTALMTDDFRDTALVNLPEPTYTLTIYENGKPIVINLYKDNNSMPVTYTAQISEINQQFKFNEGLANVLMKKKKDFIPEAPKNTEQQKPPVMPKK